MSIAKMKCLCVLNLLLVYLTEKFVIGQYQQYQQHGCGDRLDPYTCRSWKASGMCSGYTYRFLVTENCQNTCGLCPDWSRSRDISITCADRRNSCFKWRQHCQPTSEFYSFMSKNCERSCLFCEDDNCVDKKTRCDEYKERGYCETHHVYQSFMRKNCELTCKYCLGVVDKEEETRNKIANYKKEYLCDFEVDECDWSNNVFEDTAEWVMGHDENGPVSGFNQSKTYLYLDAKYDGYYGYFRLPWELVLPESEKDKGKMCFHFMYQINHGAELYVSQQANPTLEYKFPAPEVQFNTKEKTTIWTHMKVNVHVSDGYELIIKGVKGEPESYIAIDYVFFTQGSC